MFWGRQCKGAASGNDPRRRDGQVAGTSRREGLHIHEALTACVGFRVIPWVSYISGLTRTPRPIQKLFFTPQAAA